MLVQRIDDSNKSVFPRHFKIDYAQEKYILLLPDVYVFARTTFHRSNQTSDRSRPTKQNLPREDRRCMKCYLSVSNVFWGPGVCVRPADHWLNLCWQSEGGKRLVLLLQSTVASPAFLFTYALIAGTFGAPQMTSEPVCSIFSVFHCSLGLGELQACPFLNVVFSPLFLSVLPSSLCPAVGSCGRRK